ncbi:Hypothetical protein CINCED_3A000801 [Cinara cedri]|nr:Hypothetical protein CINCED_3A000801 [Cinara cedri]
MSKKTCHKCDLQLLKSEYSLHIERIHSHKCNFCDKIFVRMKTMQNHKDIMHKNEMDVNTNQTTNVLSFQTNQFQIVKNMSIHINESQTLSGSRNLAEHINDVHILPVNNIGMKNTEGVNKSQTHLNNILFDELDKFIEVHELPTDLEMTSIGIQNIGVSHLNKPQTNRNKSLAEKCSQFFKVNKPQTNIEINKDIMGQTKNLKNIKKNTQLTHTFICFTCDLQFMYQHEYNKHIEKKHNHINNVHKLKNKNSNTEISVNEPNHHLNKTTMLKPYESQINCDKTNINKTTSLQVNAKNNVSNVIPVFKQTGMKINSVGSVNCTSSMNIMCDEYTNFATTLNTNNHSNFKYSYTCNICAKSFVNRRTMISHMQVLHKQSTNIPKSICTNTQSHPYFKPNAQIQSNITLVNKSTTVQKKVNEHVKFEDMQAGKDQINCSKNKGGLPIVPNDKQTHKNNIHEHDQQNENLNLLHHNIQSQDTVVYPCDEKKPVIKHTEHVCDLCDGHFSSQSSLKRHSFLNHNINCLYCKKKFARNCALKKHCESIHANDTAISCIQKRHIDTSSQQNEMLQLQPGNIKKDHLPNQAAISQINCNKNIGILSVISNNVTYPCDDKKPVIRYTEHVCDLCDGRFSGQSSLKRHSLLIHNINCRYCEKKFARNCALKKHCESIHLHDIANSYIQNGHINTSSQPDEMLQLQPGNIKNDDSANQTAVYQMNRSNNRTSHLVSNNKQMPKNVTANPYDEKKIVIKQTEFECHICGGQFSGNKVLQNHSATVHNLNCPHCEKKFIRKLTLKRHISTHDNDNQNSCILKEHVGLPTNQLDKMIKLDCDKIRQINCSNNIDIFSIVPNDEHTHENNVQEHEKSYNNQLQETVPYPYDEKMHVNKLKGFMCNICGGQFRTKSEFNSHKGNDHKYKCSECQKKFIRNVTLQKHIQVMHIQHNENVCVKKTGAVALSQQDEMLKLQSDFIKKDSHEHQINCSKDKSVLPIVQNDTYINDVLEYDQQNQTQDVWQENIVSGETVVNISNEMHINKIDKLSDFENILPTISQTNCSDINNVLKHSQLKEAKNLKLHNYQLPEEVAAQSNYNEHKRYICSICNGQYTNLNKFYRHVETEHKNKCLFCNKKFIRKNTLKKHTQSMHGNYKKNSHIEMLVDINMENLPDRKQFNCKETKSVLPTVPNDVNMYSNNLSKFVKPCKNQKLQLCQQEVDDKEQVSKYAQYFCNICNVILKNKTQLKQHLAIDHKFKCLQCEKKFVRNIDLENHLWAEHKQKIKISRTKMTNTHNTKQSKPEKLSTETQLICDFCDSQFKNIYDLGYHLLKVHNYKCSLCEKKFVRIGDIERHKNAEHRHYFEKQNLNKKFCCKECNSWFSTDESLQSHIKYAHILMPKRFTCYLCTITHANNDEFFKHMELYHLAPNK